jgi:Domain of unknown function (DUF4145)
MTNSYFISIEEQLRLPQRVFNCPHCNIRSLHQRIETPDPLYYTSDTLITDQGKQYRAQVLMQHLIYRCVNCKKDTYFLMRGTARTDPRLDGVKVEAPPEIVQQYPVYSLTGHSSVNQDVRKAIIEAENCFSVNAFNACGVMARRAIHCLCSDKGAKGKDLYEQLKYLKDNNLITPDLWDWAEELRIVGRSGAHPEWEEISKGEADYALRFLREIIRYVYINPAERAATRLKETKKKK